MRATGVTVREIPRVRIDTVRGIPFPSGPTPKPTAMAPKKKGTLQWESPTRYVAKDLPVEKVTIK